VVAGSKSGCREREWLQGARVVAGSESGSESESGSRSGEQERGAGEGMREEQMRVNESKADTGSESG
jgi:hypothetical protein